MVTSVVWYGTSIVTSIYRSGSSASRFDFALLLQTLTLSDKQAIYISYIHNLDGDESMIPLLSPQDCFYVKQGVWLCSDALSYPAGCFRKYTLFACETGICQHFFFV